ncbi:TetR/AcrR family transcriptional regulator [Macrococcus epidermidis]|uniref:TetR/AcrR family transcriptional regulator n=1 Tax=Macrococcus epidermidis TaxID=1902580 RepID=UPI0020B766AF|nr:TetR/AcrR family transcriptional regulator [Macrococcus epidermidis]UTH16338.1 TetR/AcrR family transcriptional regulator [Macrococcus epidermidis]
MKQRSDAMHNKKRILETANRLFSANSISEVAMKQIATDCGIGQGTLYRHFSSKAEICQALMDEAIEEMFVEIKKIQQTQLSDSEKVKEILHSFVTLISDNREKLEEMKTEGSKRKVMMDLHFYPQLKAALLNLVEALNIVKDADFHTDIMLNSFSKDVFEHHCIEKNVQPKTFADRIHYIFIERLME